MTSSAVEPPPPILLEAASPEQRQTLNNLFQLYIHDFSEQWWDRPDGELNESGTFGDVPLEDFWKEPGHYPLLIRRNGALVGFALVDARSHTGGGLLDRNMTEFFIARKYRRGGVGTAAAQAIFSRYPGLWEAAVARRNTGALAFWRGAIGSHPAVSEIDEQDVDTELWNGWVLRFRIGGKG